MDCLLSLAAAFLGSSAAAPSVSPLPPPARPLAPVASPLAGDVPPLASAADFWSDWAAAHKYKLVPTVDGRMVLLIPAERSRLERSLELVTKSLARVDAILPPPPGRAPPAPPAPDKPLPWGSSDRVLDTDTMVLGLFRKPADFGDALDRIGAAFPYMQAWARSAKEQPGCILERPLFGACVDNVPGMQEWNPDNELVHRAAQLAVIRRFGRQPVWVGLGCGWNVEFDVLKSIYCFPWRDSFVWATEHGGWENDLRRMFKKRESEPLAIAELAAIRRGGFKVEDAARAWGTMRFLVQHYGTELPGALEQFQMRRDALARVPSADGKSWTMAADFELAAEEQGRILADTIAPDVFAQASDWFRQGANWKKPAKAQPPR